MDEKESKKLGFAQMLTDTMFTDGELELFVIYKSGVGVMSRGIILDFNKKFNPPFFSQPQTKDKLMLNVYASKLAVESRLKSLNGFVNSAHWSKDTKDMYSGLHILKVRDLVQMAGKILENVPPRKYKDGNFDQDLYNKQVALMEKVLAGE